MMMMMIFLLNNETTGGVYALLNSSGFKTCITNLTGGNSKKAKTRLEGFPDKIQELREWKIQ